MLPLLLNKLWFSCDHALTEKGWVHQNRCDSERRSQAAAHLDDVIEAFDLLYGSDDLPLMLCEAKDLLLLPPLSLDPVSEQLSQNTDNLEQLATKIVSLVTDLTVLMTSMKSELGKLMDVSAPSSSSLGVTHPAWL